MWGSSAKILETKGFQFGGILTGIALDVSQGVPPRLASTSDLKIEIVQSDSELESFTNLAGNAFAMSPQATEQGLALNGSVTKKNEQVHFMAYLNGTPVGTATLSVVPLLAGIRNLATLTEYRKQVMAILKPKGMAWGLFTKMGFRKVCEFPFYFYGASPEELEK
jgi:hypothetical protein